MKAIKTWLKIIIIIGLGLLINVLPIILSISYNNWWFMLLYIIVPIMDVIYISILHAIIEIFEL